MLLKAYLLLLTVGVAKLSDTSYYKVLGVEKDATIQEIRQAYKKLVIKLHPDKNPDADQETFLKIIEAYETLKDSEKRQKYDLYGSFSMYKQNYQSQSEYNQLFYNGLYWGDEYVETLIPEGFNSHVSMGLHFINFYSPFCPPCQRLSDSWKKLAQRYHGIVHIGAVNCKFYNSFCYNNVRINSYPTLLFYPGVNNYIHYKGGLNYDSIDSYLMAEINKRIIVGQAKAIDTDECVVYIMGTVFFDENAAKRIAYHLKGVAKVLIVDTDVMRVKLDSKESTSAVIKCDGVTEHVETSQERQLLEIASQMLPKAQNIDVDKFKMIRDSVRDDSNSFGWVLEFTNSKPNNLLINKLKFNFPTYHFGQINCDENYQLCLTLHSDSTPNWAILKKGGVYQRAVLPTMPPSVGRLIEFIRKGMVATKLQTLSVSDYKRIIQDSSPWAVAVIPFGSKWENIREIFIDTAMDIATHNIQFGILACSSMIHICSTIARHATIVVHINGRQHFYETEGSSGQFQQHLTSVMNSMVVELTEQSILEVLDAGNRDKTWLVAFMPAKCGHHCDKLGYQWHKVSEKLSPLTDVNVGAIWCKNKTGFCNNVKAPTVKLLFPHTSKHYVTSLENLGEAPYIWEWALQYIETDLVTLTHNTFAKHIHRQPNEPWLVYFHSPRCHHCYDMFADYILAARTLKKHVKFARVDCLSERVLCRSQQVTRYPTLRLFYYKHSTVDTVTIPLKNYLNIILDVKRYLQDEDEFFMNNRVDQMYGFNMKHDEL